LPAFGQQTIEESEGQNSMASAEAVAPAPMEVMEKERTVGQRTFIHSDGKWIDTRFDPEHMETIEIEFLSDEYFLIAKERPDLAEAFALGSRVIVVDGEYTYEVVEGPVNTNREDPNLTLPVLNPTQAIPTVEKTAQLEVDSDNAITETKYSPLCWNGLILSLIAVSIVGVVRIRISNQ